MRPLVLLTALPLLVLQCGGRSAHLSPQARYDSIQSQFVSGDLDGAGAAALEAAGDAASQGPLWSTRLRLQRARIDIYQGDNSGALTLLQPPFAEGISDPALGVMRSSLLAIAYVRLHDSAHTDQSLREAAALCRDEPSRSQLHLAEGIVGVERNNLEVAEQAFTLGLTSARISGDRFAQTQLLLGLAVVALRQDHYEDALQRFGEVSTIARAINARQALEKAEGSAGKTRYRMGDLPQALVNAKNAADAARTLGSPIDEAQWLIDAGLIYYQMGNLKAAREATQQAYTLARSMQNSEETKDALLGVALLSEREGNVQGALEKAQQAEQVARSSSNNSDIFQPALLEGQILLKQGKLAASREKLLDTLSGAGAAKLRSFDRWQIESTLAQVEEAAGDSAGAATWAQRAIETFRTQRESLSEIGSRLPFSENGTELYRDYMEELLREGKTADALAVLDRSRAETLADGAANTLSSDAWAKSPQSVAKRLHGTILVYCLRPQTSYLWAITPVRTTFFRLPGAEIITPLVQRHSRAILSGQDVLSQAGASGRELYRSLIGPAEGQIPHGGKAFVIADGELNHLNFETLLPPGDKPHFWIEDVDVVNAKSMSLLAARSASPAQASMGKKLLLVGDPVYSGAEFEKLPNAGEEVAEVAGHFPGDRSTLLTGNAATRTAYLGSRPSKFRYIHFTAHATASEINPLDSAVVLSAQPGEPGSYRLYARDIMNSKLHAELVTISACYGSGVRTYSGEGLVGLAWAFLRAGSHNVVGALWEVSDVSTPQLMNEMYDGLAAGRSPDVALRSAKLAMISRGGVFQKPYYWAAFQLYSGS